MNFVVWILLGGLLGGGANWILRRRKPAPIIGNIVIGIAGVMSAGWLLGLLTESSAFAQDRYGLANLIVSLLGATVLLVAVELIRVRWSDAGTPEQSEAIEMNSTPRTFTGLRPLLAAGLAGILMLVGACASAPPAPDSALDAARVAISNADKAEAGQYAGAELREAREKLASADSAVQEENMVGAERFAQESRVQAELASARTAAAKATAVNKEMERGADALSEEMQRAGEPR
jgi:uncharacterized membrane protein YeaQ/YmgE (transglycosylase-associated protein family)